MGFFERGRRPDDSDERAALRAARENLAAAQEQAAQAQREAGYANARKDELLPLLVEQDTLTLQVQSAARDIESARSILDLTRRIHERRPNDSQLAEDEARAAAELKAREDAHAATTADLARVEGEIGRKDAELRSRFGLGAP